MDISSWYNNADYSDLIVKLRHGRETKVHKHVLCTTNEWFKKACGIGSNFAESKLDTIELKEDDPDAVEAVLRYLYKAPFGLRAQPGIEKPWRFWLDVHIAADKYLVPALSEQAYTSFCTYARTEWSLDNTIDTLEMLTTEMAHDDKLAALATELREKHLRQLLKDKRYRKKLENDKVLLWEHVDELLAAEHDQSTQPYLQGQATKHDQGTQAQVQAQVAENDQIIQAQYKLYLQAQAGRIASGGVSRGF